MFTDGKTATLDSLKFDFTRSCCLRDADGNLKAEFSKGARYDLCDQLYFMDGTFRDTTYRDGIRARQFVLADDYEFIAGGVAVYLWSGDKICFESSTPSRPAKVECS